MTHPVQAESLHEGRKQVQPDSSRSIVRLSAILAMLSRTLFVLLAFLMMRPRWQISGDMRMIEFRDGVGHGRCASSIVGQDASKPLFGLRTIISRQRLCGLVLGRISRNRVYASIHYLAANPEQETPLSGVFAQLAVRYLELQAVALGCTMLSIAKPVESLVNFYGTLGFTLRQERPENSAS